MQHTYMLPNFLNAIIYTYVMLVCNIIIEFSKATNDFLHDSNAQANQASNKRIEQNDLPRHRVCLNTGHTQLHELHVLVQWNARMLQ